MKAILLLGTVSVQAQDMQFKLVDSGVLNHSIHGQGVEMRIEPSLLPEDGLKNPVFEQAMRPICRHYAATVIPFVIERTELKEPDFIAVRIISGGPVGQYLLQAFEIENGTCGGALD